MQKRVFLIIAALGLMGCGDPCADLEARLCSDLGADCADFRASGKFEMLTPTPRGRRGLKGLISDWLFPPRNDVCEAVGESPRYEAWLKPQAQYAARYHRNPATAGPMPTFVMPPDGGGGFGYYLIVPLFIAGIFGYTFWFNKRARAGIGQDPGAGTGTGT